MRLQDHFEVEVKLCVVGDDPEALFDEIARLDRVGSLRLGPPAEHRLHDVYWDSPGRDLRARKVSLRLRAVDDRTVFTAKGGTSNSDGLFRRYELEVPATRENWDGLREALAAEGVALPSVDGDDGPAAWLGGAGLVPTQDRVTRRTIRYAYAADSNDTPVAELALDRTRFDFGAVLVDYWEIEIEQLDSGDEAPREIGQALLARYPGRLEPSPMGKYARGLALERELRASGQIS